MLMKYIKKILAALALIPALFIIGCGVAALITIFSLCAVTVWAFDELAQ